jgi:hypothetical protein
VLVFNAFLLGRKTGEQSVKLSDNATAIKENDSTLNKQTTELKNVNKQDSILTVYHTRVREKVVVSHDTIYLATQKGVDSLVAVSPAVSRLIQSDDSLIAAQQRSIALRDTLIASLRLGIKERDDRIKLLEAPTSKITRLLNAAKWITTGVVVGLAVSHR